jgi:hypothetical protein
MEPVYQLCMRTSKGQGVCIAVIMEVPVFKRAI